MWLGARNAQQALREHERIVARRATVEPQVLRTWWPPRRRWRWCYHVGAHRLSKVPEDYAGCFTLLRDDGLIEPEPADRLGHLARFRNLRVHMYWKIDYDRVYNVMQHDFDDLRRLRAG